MEVHATVRLLLDPDRLAVAGALVRRARTTDEVVAATGADRRTVLSAIGDLRGAGLVTTDDGNSYQVDVAVLRRVAQGLAVDELPMDPVIGFGMTEAEQTVLARHFSGRTLVDIPASRSRRQVVLQRLALEFDLGRRYDEDEVNALLRTFHPDTAALRRYLYDEQLLDRDHVGGRYAYWRSGGRFVDDARPG